MTLFLDGIYDEGRLSPSTIVIRYPTVDGGSRPSIRGLMTSEPTLSSKNKWGPILNDITNIQDVASLLGSSEMWSWIGASVMCWKGTEPIKTTIEFYLINYKQGLKLDEKLKDLNYLTSLHEIKGKAIAVKVHGGYQARVLETNTAIFSNGSRENRGLGEYLKPFQDGANYENFEQGTIEIQFGSKMSMRNMLIANMDVTPSIVEVADIHGNNPKPLYYRVSLGLIGARPLLSTDVDAMYKRLPGY